MGYNTRDCWVLDFVRRPVFQTTLSNTTLWKIDLLPPSGGLVGDAFSDGSIRKS
jgi:hypothetical protein